MNWSTVTLLCATAVLAGTSAGLWHQMQTERASARAQIERLEHALRSRTPTPAATAAGFGRKPVPGSLAATSPQTFDLPAGRQPPQEAADAVDPAEVVDAVDAEATAKAEPSLAEGEQPVVNPAPAGSLSAAPARPAQLTDTP